MMQSLEPRTHPAAEWALQQSFDSVSVNCTISVVLKILDGKCKMLPGEKAAIMAIYDVIELKQSTLFKDEDFTLIEAARESMDGLIADSIHRLRVYAESEIPKPVMKQYKSVLRNGMFGE